MRYGKIAILGGLIAGAGLAVMMAAGRRGGLLNKTLAEESEDWLDRTVGARRRLGAAGTTLLEQLNHLGASAAFGFGYGLLRERMRGLPAPALGGAYGAALYALNIGAIAPRLGITEGEAKAGPAVALQRLGMHLFYGIGTAAATEYLASRLNAAGSGRRGAAASNRKFAQVGGISMSWLEEGEGMPVILIHGVPTSPELWRDVMPRLEGVRALAWEMVGYGRSIGEGRGRDLSVARQAEHLAAWMRQLGIEQAIIGGHDLGGGVAQILAVRHSQLCSGLLLTNGIGYDSWPIPSVSAMKASAPLMRHLPEPLFKLLLATFYFRGHDDAAKAVEAYRVHAPNYLDHGGAAALIRQIEWLDVKDTLAVADRLPELAVPARIVWGAADRFQKIEYGRRFSRDLAAPLRRIEGGKHFTPEDHPDILAEEIMELVRAVRQREGSPEKTGHGLDA